VSHLENIRSEPIDLTGHFVVAGQRRKDVEHVVDGGDVAELLDRFAQIQEKARLPTGRSFPIVAIQEAGLDGFWIHRVPEDAASIATSRRRRRAKTDKIDGEALVRALLAFTAAALSRIGPMFIASSNASM